MDKITDLMARIEALKAEAEPVRQQLGNIDRQRAKLRKELAAEQQKLAKMAEEPRVSDHAVIRWLERRHGFDFENVRQQLLTDNVKMAIDFGCESIKIDGGTLKVRGKTVTTFF